MRLRDPLSPPTFVGGGLLVLLAASIAVAATAADFADARARGGSLPLIPTDVGIGVLAPTASVGLSTVNDPSVTGYGLLRLAPSGLSAHGFPYEISVDPHYKDQAQEPWACYVFVMSALVAPGGRSHTVCYVSLPPRAAPLEIGGVSRPSAGAGGPPLPV